MFVFDELSAKDRRGYLFGTPCTYVQLCIYVCVLSSLDTFKRIDGRVTRYAPWYGCGFGSDWSEIKVGVVCGLWMSVESITAALLHCRSVVGRQ